MLSNLYLHARNSFAFSGEDRHGGAKPLTVTGYALGGEIDWARRSTSAGLYFTKALKYLNNLAG